MNHIGRLIIDIANPYLTDEDRHLIQDRAVIGLILFTRNYQNKSQLKELIREVRSIKPNILITIDQEGGSVQRLRHQFIQLPSLQQIAKVAERDADIIRHAVTAMCYPLLDLHIDLSFTPVVDLYNSNSQVIGKRSFADNSERVIAIAKQYIAMMHSNGMAATIKHFPGHGIVDEDSHTILPECNANLQQIKPHMEPFKQLASVAEAVMVAHILYPQIDKQLTTYSKYWLQKQLRHQLQFKGIVFSDDMSMAGANQHSPATRVSLALESGCDIALYCNDRTAVKSVLGACDNLTSSSHDFQAALAKLYSRKSQVEENQYRESVSKLQQSFGLPSN